MILFREVRKPKGIVIFFPNNGWCVSVSVRVQQNSLNSDVVGSVVKCCSFSFVIIILCECRYYPVLQYNSPAATAIQQRWKIIIFCHTTHCEAAEANSRKPVSLFRSFSFTFISSVYLGLNHKFSFENFMLWSMTAWDCVGLHSSPFAAATG